MCQKKKKTTVETIESNYTFVCTMYIYTDSHTYIHIDTYIYKKLICLHLSFKETLPAMLVREQCEYVKQNFILPMRQPFQNDYWHCILCINSEKEYQSTSK